MRALGIALLVLLVVGVSGYALLNFSRSDDGQGAIVGPAPVGPVSVDVVRVDEGKVNQIISATAVVSESMSVVIRSPIRGTVDTVNAELGTLVKQQQPLLNYDDALAKSEYQMAQSLYQIAKQELDYYQKNLRKLQELYAQKLVSDDEIDQAQLQLNQVRRNHANARHQMVATRQVLQSTELLSPISGIVSELTVHKGISPKEYTDLMVINSIDPVLVQSQLSEEKFRSVFVGQTVALSLYAFPEKDFSGTVVRIGPELDETKRTLTVYARIANEDLSLRPGMNGIVQFKNEKHALRVPSEALVSHFENRATVFIVGSDERIERREITVNATGSGYTEVLDGLQAGERVVVSSSRLLRQGDRVTLRTVAG